MSATIINGKQIALELEIEIGKEVQEFKVRHGFSPTLVAILIGNDPASEIYVSRKQQACQRVSINSGVIHLDSSISEHALISVIEKLNHDTSVHGILLQLPIPKHINTRKIINSIAWYKDVDGLHPFNLGKLLLQESGFVPCTPLGCMHLLKTANVTLTGKRILVIGRSTLVGYPLSILLTHANATVTLAHSKTKNLMQLCQEVDIIVAALGQVEYIKTAWLKSESVVIDVGINRERTVCGAYTLVGDVERTARDKVSILTPVPGGVGPMTIAFLLKNTLKAAQMQMEE